MKKAVYIFLALLMALTSQSTLVFAQRQTVIKGFIETLEVGEPVYHQGLTIIPIYTSGRAVDKSRYTTADQAFNRGWLEVTELQGGRVPQVSLTNNSDRYIYIMGGEILTGCKQDRIVARDVLVRPRGKNILVPVYCVEQGRWRHESAKFYSKRNLGTFSLRSFAQKASPDSQSSIWGRVFEQNEKAGVSSSTQAYQAVYDQPQVTKKIKYFERHFKDIPKMHDDTVGVVVAVGGQIVSVDIFGKSYLFKKLWPKILKSSALSAITSSKFGRITQDDAVYFLRQLHDKHYRAKPAIDLGREFSSLDQELNVNALVYGSSLVHLAGFVQEAATIGPWSSEDSERRIPVMRR